jgi:hypothetical protein
VRITIAGIIVLLVLTALSPSAGEDVRMDYTKDRIPAEQFVIFPWGGMPAIDKPGSFWGSVSDMDPVMKDLWECGFNTTGFTDAANIRYARKYGLSVIVQDGRIPREGTDAEALEVAKQVAGPLKDDPSVLAFYLRDEPATPAFSNLAKWAKALATIAPDKLAYINLYPDYASPEGLGAKDYDDYLEQFVSVCKPKFLSYDNYSLFEGGTLLADRFYGNMEAIRACALRHDLPWWNIVLGNSHFTYIEPSQASIYVQVYSTLAYGGRGISYFTYFPVPHGNFRLSAIDQFMHKTATWDYIRLMNLQIHRLAPSLLKLKSVNVFHHPNVPKGCRGIDSSRFVAGLDGGGDLLVGEFEGPGKKPYVMVVNKSISNSTHFGVRFKEQGRVLVTNSYTGADADFGGEQVWLAPGQGMLLHLER